MVLGYHYFMKASILKSWICGNNDSLIHAHSLADEWASQEWMIQIHCQSGAMAIANIYQNEYWMRQTKS